jgi:hypothetical protein
MKERSAPIDSEDFEQFRAAGRPVVMRGLVSDWPAVEASRKGVREIAAYLVGRYSQRPVNAIAASPKEMGRFFYTEDLSRLNFVKASGRLDAFLDDLLKASDMELPPAMAVQSEDVASLLPGFLEENPLDLLPGVPPRIWIGNRIRVAPHYDAKENVACCLAGRRRFTLFPPERTADLYPGPFELTPAGTPVSMVDIAEPDFERFPRFERACNEAQQVTLEPGDAIYIPYGWWHGVESLEPVSILVNYWWTPELPDGVGNPYDGLLHAMLAFRHLPADERRVWRTMLDYYVFGTDGDAAEHLPDHAKGILGPPSPAMFAQMRALIRRALGPAS